MALPAFSSLVGQTHALPAHNHTAASILFLQLFIAWTNHLKEEQTFLDSAGKTYAGSVDRSAKQTSQGRGRRPKLLFQLTEDFSPDELTFSGPVDEDGWPHGAGLVRLPRAVDAEAAVQSSCVRGVCDRPLLGVNGTFVHGLPLGQADVIFVSGDVLRGHFDEDGVLEGFALELAAGGGIGQGHVRFAGFYERGRRVGQAWQIDPNFSTAVYGALDGKKGHFTTAGDDGGNDNDNDGVNKRRGGIFLVQLYERKRDVLVLGGKFKNGILVSEQAKPKSIASVRFSHDGLLMHFDVRDEEAEDGDGPATPSYTFRPAPNLYNDDDRQKAQAAWLWMRHNDDLEPKGAIINKTLYEMPPPSPLAVDQEANTDETEAKEKDDPDALLRPRVAWPKSTDEICSNMTWRYRPQGSLRESLLSCYPGSGSKWLLSTLTYASGVGTYGCLGEDPLAGTYLPESGLLIKTHHQDADRWSSKFSVMNKHSKRWMRSSEDLTWRLHHMAQYGGRAVVLLRNPYEALISFWNHDRSHTYDSPKEKSGLMRLAESLQTDMFRDFVRAEIRLWSEIYLDYLSLAPRLLVVHYEHLKRDMDRELRRIHEYLDIPADDERLRCVRDSPHQHYHRKKVEYANPYTDELAALVEEAIEQVQQLLKARGQPLLPLDSYKWRKVP